MADGVVARQRVALLHHAPGEPGDHAVVLGVHHDERPVAPRGGHHVEDLLVHEAHALVGHEDLERADARLDRRRQVGAERLRVRVGDDQVKAVVDHRLRLRALVVVGEHRRERVAAVLRAERHDGGGAAVGRGHRRRVEVVRAQDAEGGHLLHVAMAVDAARQHQLAARLDRALALQALPQLGDPPIADADVAIERPSGGGDLAAADHEVQGHGRIIGGAPGASITRSESALTVRARRSEHAALSGGEPPSNSPTSRSPSRPSSCAAATARAARSSTRTSRASKD